MKKKASKKFKIIKRIVFIVILYFVASSFYSVLSQISDNNDQIATLNKQIEAERKITKDLEAEKLKSNTDEYYKQVARETLGLVSPGDKVYINSNKTTSKWGGCIFDAGWRRENCQR